MIEFAKIVGCSVMGAWTGGAAGFVAVLARHPRGDWDLAMYGYAIGALVGTAVGATLGGRWAG